MIVSLLVALKGHVEIRQWKQELAIRFVKELVIATQFSAIEALVSGGGYSTNSRAGNGLGNRAGNVARLFAVR